MGEREAEAPQLRLDGGSRLGSVTQQSPDIALQQQRPRPGQLLAQPAILAQGALNGTGDQRELVGLQGQGAVRVRLHQRDQILDRPVPHRRHPVNEQAADDHADDQRQDRVAVQAGKPLGVQAARNQGDVVQFHDVGGQRPGGIGRLAQRDPVEHPRREHSGARFLDLRKVHHVVRRGDDAQLGVVDKLQRVGRPGGLRKDSLEQIPLDVNDQPAVGRAAALPRRQWGDHLHRVVNHVGEAHALRGTEARSDDVGEGPEPGVVVGVQQRPLRHLIVGGREVATRRDHHVELRKIDVDVGAAGAGGVVVEQIAGNPVRAVVLVMGNRPRLEQHAAERAVVGDDVVELGDVAHDGVEIGLHLLQEQLVGAACLLGEDRARAAEHRRAEDDRDDENQQEREQVGVEQPAFVT